MDDSNSDWDSLPHEEQGKKNLRIHINESNMKILTHSIRQIQLWCPRSKWNMGEILAFLA